MINTLWIKNFRNIEETLLHIQKETNFFIFGDNNQGKTNLLESLYVIANGQSPVEKNIPNLINFDKKEAIIGIKYEHNGKEDKIYIKLTSSGERYALINNQKVKNFRDIKKKIPIDFISADIIRIFQEHPERRRQELNVFCEILYPEYAKHHKQYKRVLRQKNSSLKNQLTHAEIKQWNKQLIHFAEPILELRQDAVSRLEKELQKLALELNKEYKQKVQISYIQKGNKTNTLLTKDNFSKMIYNAIEKERLVGFALYGPHRDDFKVEINKRALEFFYSRGINRGFAILLKIAQLNVIERKFNGFPILLIDDAFAELDLKIKKRLIEIISKRTTFFYATVEKQDHRLMKAPKVYKMKAGLLSNG